MVTLQMCQYRLTFTPNGLTDIKIVWNAHTKSTVTIQTTDSIDMSKSKLHEISVSQPNLLKSRNLFSWQSMRQTCIIDEVHGFNTQVLLLE